MIIKNVTYRDITKALAHTNRVFADNIGFRDVLAIHVVETVNSIPPSTDSWEDDFGAYRVTLRRRDCRLPGAARSASGRATIGACWHAHGTFFRALPEGAIIVTCHHTTTPLAPWCDYNVGSVTFPVPASSCCTCSERWSP